MVDMGSCSYRIIADFKVGEEFEKVEQKEDNILADDLREFFIGVHGDDAMVGTQRWGVNDNWMGMPFYFILLSIFIEEVFSDLVCILFGDDFLFIKVDMKEHLFWRDVGIVG